MTRDELGGIVRNVIYTHLDVDLDKITDKSAFIDDLGADSLDRVELIFALEEEFDVEITDTDAEAVETVGDAVKLIEQKLGVSA